MDPSPKTNQVKRTRHAISSSLCFSYRYADIVFSRCHIAAKVFYSKIRKKMIKNESLIKGI